MADPVIGPPAPVAAPVATPPTPAAVPAGSVTLYDRDSKPVVVDSEQAHAAILSGQLGYAPGTRIPVRVDGKIGTVDADGLSEAVSKYGAKPVTGKEYHQHELQQQYGSTPQAALAFGTAALDSATIGASNAVIGGLGGQHAREYIRNVEEANPAATTAGDVAGFVAPIAADVLSAGTLTGPLAAAEAARVAGRVGERALVRGAEEAAGKGLARTAAEAVLTGPTKLVSGIGDLAESATRSIVGKNAESAAARTAQNIIAGGVRGGVEGGLYGVGQEAGHQFLQDDPNFTGETLATAFTHGALVGGALGGLTHGVAGMLKNKAPKALTEAADGREVGAETKALGEASPTLTSKAADAILSQVDDPKKRATLKRAFEERGPHGFAEHGTEVLDDAKRTVTKSLDEALEAGHIVDKGSFLEKAEQMGKLVPKENLAPAKAAAMKVWEDAQKVLDTLTATEGKIASENASIRKLREQMKGLVQKTEGATEPATVMMAIDNFKRSVGKESAYGSGPFGLTHTQNVLGRDEDNLYNRIARVLEDESTFGAGGVAQKEVNAATTEMLGNSRYFSKFITPFDSHAGNPIYRARDGAVDSFINGLTRPSGDLDAESFKLFAQRRGRYLDAVEKNYSFDAAGKAAIAKERKALVRMTETIAKTSNDVAHVNQLKQVLDSEKGHGIHGIIGLALDSVTKPGLSLARLAELEATKNRAIAKIQNGFKQVRAALDGGAKPGLTPKLETHDTYEQRRTSVLAAASQPDVVQASLNGATAPIAPHAPDAANAFRGASIRTLQYLMTALPKPPPPRADALTPQIDMEDWQPNDQQKYTFNQQYDIVTHPEHALTYVANGTITATQVDALAAAQPAHLAHQRNMLQSSLASRTKPVPYAMQGPVQTFLGKPQMAPELQPFMQPVTPPQQNQAPPKRPLKFSDTTTLNASNVK